MTYLTCYRKSPTLIRVRFLGDSGPKLLPGWLSAYRHISHMRSCDVWCSPPVNVTVTLTSDSVTFAVLCHQTSYVILIFDVRITNETCDSQRTSAVQTILRKHETEKKRQYNQRVIEIEHGTFTPLVFTTFGAMGQECDKF